MIRVINRNTTVTAIMDGEIDHCSCGIYRDRIEKAIMDSAVKELRLDFTQVTFMDSSGVGLVMGRYRYAVTLGKKVRVDNLDDRNYKIMQMSGIPKIAEINRKEN